MKFKILEKEFEKVPLFKKRDLRLFERNKNNLDLNIKYWLNSGKLINLKKGWYVITDKEKKKRFFLEFLANKTIEPSYLSADYVLSKNNLLTEGVFSFSSMTTKTKREINNKLGSFRYYSISNNLFKGYFVKKVKDLFIFEAELPKAFFDFLYIRFFKERKPNEGNLKNLRINWENMSKKDFLKSKKYLKYTKSKNMEKLYNIIKKKYYAD